MTPAGKPVRIMLGFVVRQCARALGHPPSPEELAAWANDHEDEAGGRYAVFGRTISAEDARVILRHPSRMVTVRPGPRWEFAAMASEAAAEADASFAVATTLRPGVPRPPRPAGPPPAAGDAPRPATVLSLSAARRARDRGRAGG
jgi:hypothetical protein